MKKLLILFTGLAIAVTSFDAFAADCPGARVTLDPIRNQRFGCSCSKDTGDITAMGRNSLIFAAAPGLMYCKDYRWHHIDTGNNPPVSTGKCAGWEDFSSDKHEYVPNLEKVCWQFKCKVGYFNTDENGQLKKNECVPCNGLNDSIQGDTCMHVKCGGDAGYGGCTGVLGKECMVYNSTCMPVCDMQMAAEKYDNNGFAIRFNIITNAKQKSAPDSSIKCPLNSTYDADACKQLGYSANTAELICVNPVGCKCKPGYEAYAPAFNICHNPAIPVRKGR